MEQKLKANYFCVCFDCYFGATFVVVVINGVAYGDAFGSKHPTLYLSDFTSLF